MWRNLCSLRIKPEDPNSTLVRALVKVRIDCSLLLITWERIGYSIEDSCTERAWQYGSDVGKQIDGNPWESSPAIVPRHSPYIFESPRYNVGSGVLSSCCNCPFHDLSRMNRLLFKLHYNLPQ